MPKYNRIIILLTFAIVSIWWGRVSWAQGNVLTDLEISLPALPEPMKYSLYLPREYCRTDTLFPVLYLLHGYGGTHKDWIKAGGVIDTLDRLVADKVIEPMIVVMPSAAKSWYINSSKHGQFQTALAMEFPDLIERELGNRVQVENRSIAGLSMGGYGALKYAFEHPSTFSSVAGLSPAIFPNVSSHKDFRPVQIKLFAEAFGKPFSSDRFNSENIFSSLTDIKNPPRTYLTVGDDDWFGLYDGTFALYKEMRSRKQPVELRITNGNHDWKLWKKQIGPALIFINSSFEGMKAGTSTERDTSLCR